MRDARILPAKCFEISRRIASGELTAETGSHAILDLVHEERLDASKSMASAIIDKNLGVAS